MLWSIAYKDLKFLHVVKNDNIYLKNSVFEKFEVYDEMCEYITA